MGHTSTTPRRSKPEELPKSFSTSWIRSGRSGSRWATTQLLRSRRSAWQWEFANSPNLTKDQLAQVVEKAKILVKEQVVSLRASYADGADLVIRGEADSTYRAGKAQLSMAKEKGASSHTGFFTETAGGCATA